jgi:putative endonuclease
VLTRHVSIVSVAGVTTTDPRHALGLLGEQLAARHLERLGFEVVARRHRTRFGELDLVCSDGDLLVFVEVKTRRAGPTGPWEALGDGKRAQVRRMAAAYLHDSRPRPFFSQLRFDAIGVTVSPRGELVALEHLEGAF